MTELVICILAVSIASAVCAYYHSKPKGLPEMKRKNYE